MPAILVDFVRRAAEALVAANRAEDPEAGTRLRQTAYDLLERAREREDALRRADMKAERADAVEAPIRRAEPPLSS